MNRQLALGLFCAAFLVLAIALKVWAQWPMGLEVAETPHNLIRPASVTDPDMAGLLENYNEVCVYCHASHGGSTAQALWNRRAPSGPYEMFDDGTSMIMDSQPSGNSLACLSCHDGTIGLDDILDPPATYTGGGAVGTSIEECEDCHRGGDPPGGVDWEGVWFDTDLRKHHPISLLYDPSRAPNFRSVAEVETAGLEFFEGKIQCMTCHEPHKQEFRPFLRVTMSSRALCFVCHTNNPGENTAHHW